MSEASLRAAIPPHFSKESPCWGIYSNLRGISAKLDTIGAAKTHTVCVHLARRSAVGRQPAACARAPRHAPATMRCHRLRGHHLGLTCALTLRRCRAPRSEDLAHYRQARRGAACALNGAQWVPAITLRA